MVNFLEGLYVVTALSLLVAGLAFVQSRGGGERAERYGRRMRTALGVAIVAGTAAIVIYRQLSY